MQKFNKSSKNITKKSKKVTKKFFLSLDTEFLPRFRVFFRRPGKKIPHFFSTENKSFCWKWEKISLGNFFPIFLSQGNFFPSSFQRRN